MTLSAKDFNVVGDGEHDNTPELIALRDHIRAGPDTVWPVEFEPGHYHYTDNRWLRFGDRTVILEFNGSKVECASDAVLPLGGGPLSWAVEYPLTQTQANATIPPGYLIETTAVAAREVKLKETLAGEFRAGDRVLVAGNIQQFSQDGKEGWGWPPNFRYFEWKTVAAATDELTLRFVDPFRYAYDAGWQDFVHSFSGRSLLYGAPRIWRARLDDGRHINRSLTIRNANFKGGRNRPAGTFTPIAANGWHLTLDKCTGDEGTVCWPTLAYRVDFLDCRFGGDQVELDKALEQFRAERCDFLNRVASGGAAVLDVYFRACNFYGIVQVTPRRSLRFDGACRFYNGVMLSRGLTNTPFALTSAASQV